VVQNLINGIAARGPGEALDISNIAQARPASALIHDTLQYASSLPSGRAGGLACASRGAHACGFLLYLIGQGCYMHANMVLRNSVQVQRESFDVIGRVGFDHDFGVSRRAALAMSRAHGARVSVGAVCGA